MELVLRPFALLEPDIGDFPFVPEPIDLSKSLASMPA